MVNQVRVMSFFDHINSAMTMLEQMSPENRFLNSPFHTMLLQGIRQLRSGKSPGIDKSMKKWYRAVQKSFINLYASYIHLFNPIWKTKTLPHVWATSVIVLLHKNGSWSDPNNYRGIAMSSCLNKLMTKILNSRLEKYMTENSLWSQNP